MKRLLLLSIISLSATLSFAQIIPGAPVVHVLKCGFPKNKSGGRVGTVEYSMACVSQATDLRYLKSCSLDSHELRLNGLVHTMELQLVKQDLEEAEFANDRLGVSINIRKSKSELRAAVNLGSMAMGCVESQ